MGFRVVVLFCAFAGLMLLGLWVSRSGDHRDAELEGFPEEEYDFFEVPETEPGSPQEKGKHSITKSWPWPCCCTTKMSN